jgi:hypothetical protein
MSIKVRIRFKRKQIIVPIRFRRALASDPPALDAPDVDERGFAMGNREETWGESDAKGAMVAVTTGDTVRVRVVTEDIEVGQPNPEELDAGFPLLFVTSTDPNVVQVVEPSNGALPAGGIFSIKGILDTKNRPVAIQVHLGAIDGPVIGELEPHVFNLLKLRCAVHRVDIRGVGAKDSSAARIAAMFATANAIWRHAGIAFSHVIQPTTVRIEKAITPGVVTEVVGSNASSAPSELPPILNRQPVPAHINIYLVSKIVVKDDKRSLEPAGQSFDKTHRTRDFTPGILLSETADGHTLAHELGHFLSLTHSDRGEADTEIRKDFWTHRRLMFSSRNDKMFPPAHHTDLGYGPGKAGCLITVKHIPGDPNDNEVARARRRAKDPY